MEPPEAQPSWDASAHIEQPELDAVQGAQGAATSAAPAADSAAHPCSPADTALQLAAMQLQPAAPEEACLLGSEQGVAAKAAAIKRRPKPLELHPLVGVVQVRIEAGRTRQSGPKRGTLHMTSSRVVVATDDGKLMSPADFEQLAGCVPQCVSGFAAGPRACHILRCSPVPFEEKAQRTLAFFGV